MEVIIVGIIVVGFLSFFIGLQVCGRCYMRPRYIDLNDYDEIDPC